MQTFRPRSGWLVVLPDSDEQRSRTGIWFPAERRRKATSGRVLWHTGPLQGKHIVFERWAWKQIDLGNLGTLYLIPEGCVLGVLYNVGEKTMNKAEVLDRLTTWIKSEVESAIPGKGDSEASVDALTELAESIAATDEDAVFEMLGISDEDEPGNESEGD